MHDTQELARLIDAKHQVLSELRKIGDRQAELIGGGDVGPLLKLLAAKQQMIARLQQLERELAPHYSQNPDQRIWPSPQARAHCARQAAECNALLDEIVRMEKQGADQMTARRNEVAQQLHQVHVASQVRSAYESQRRTHV